jgi:hypothetical protein
MVQQLGNTKTDKQLSVADIQRIAYASCLNFFHTNSMFNPWPLGIFYSVDFYYAKRINNDNYQYQHVWTQTKNSCNSPSTMQSSCGNLSAFSKSNIEASYPELVCNKDGEEKLVIACCYRKQSNFNKSKLGLFLLEPLANNNHSRAGTIFVYEVVITPKPGLFPVKK